MDSLGDGRGLAVSDFDLDGDLDFIVSNYDKPANYYVNHAAAGNWLRVRLRGRESNRDGIGAIVRVRTKDLWQMRVITAGDGFGSQCSRLAHFGLAGASTVDEIEVIWPGGRRQRLGAQTANREINIEELILVAPQDVSKSLPKLRSVRAN